MSQPGAVSRTSPKRSGHIDEWHSILFKSFEDITFDFVSGLHHSIVFLLSAFSEARLKAIGSVGNGMGCDGTEQLFVQAPTELSVTLALQRYQWLKGHC